VSFTREYENRRSLVHSGFHLRPSVKCFAMTTNKNKLGAPIWSGFAVWVIIGLILTAIIHENAFSETETSGLLRPANEPTPPIPCSQIPEGALILLLGNSASYTTASHHTFLRVAGENLLSISRRNEDIAISARIYSADRKLLAEIIDNDFRINLLNYFRRERPDRHTLAVFDQDGERVLFIHYLNPSAIKILGKFHTARGIVQISEEEVLVPGRGRLSRFCFGKRLVGIQIK
jgi:hypothetical protein